jgi:hypothetical protein
MQNGGVIRRKVAGPGYVTLVTVSGPQGKPRFQPAKDLAPEASDAIFRGAPSPEVRYSPNSECVRGARLATRPPGPAGESRCNSADQHRSLEGPKRLSACFTAPGRTRNVAEQKERRPSRLVSMAAPAMNARV